MAERVTRSKTGKTPSKPFNPGFVETPGRKKYTRKSGIFESTPEPFAEYAETNGKALNGNGLANGNGHANGNVLANGNGHVNGNGLANGNGHANGNGYTNGHANGNGYANAAAAKAEKEEEVRASDLANPAIDTAPRFDFGGSFGVSAMMIGFPCLMYYMYIGAYFYNGKFPVPAEGESLKAFLQHLWTLVKTEAYPSNRAWTIYWYFGMVQMAFYMLLPGIYRKGKQLPHLNNQQLDYYCSGMWSFYTSIVLGLVLHYTGIFKMYTLIDQFGPIMSVAIISGFLCSIIAYVSAILRGATIRMTGYPIYDFFMGAELNPRLFGILDFKMFLEVRIPWYMLFFMAMGTCLKQYEEYGYVSAQAGFLLMAMYLYAGACSKAEHLIITTWDMYYEKLGFMLIFWNMAGVPLSYCHSILFVALHHPDEYQLSPWLIGALVVAYLGVYYVWDTTNSQKNQFRQEERGVVEERTTFPYFRYGRLKDPKTISTKHGNKILCDGWYGKARKIHYTCDVFFALSWGFVTGFTSPFPWFYSAFFTVMIIHRAIRDIESCRRKYGDAWKEYEKRVPYLFIPGVF